MDCPVGGDAAIPPPDPCIADDAAGDSAATAEFELDGEYWRREVAARLQRYRARRKPREPRYPSLRLPFDSVDNWISTAAPPVMSGAGSNALAHDSVSLVEPSWEREAACDPALRPRVAREPEPFDNVIEFPRSAVVPAFHGYELADPVLDRPRIVEVPEILPPPPALGGMMIDAAAAPASERRLELPIPPAALWRRMLASVLDELILSTAMAAFAAMFVWVNPECPPWPIVAVGVAITGALFWAAYEFLFVTYTGLTPGMRLARLRLTMFDGSPVGHGRRRWRVLASYLSALSLGLGYLWSVLDEDGLCWHDRMTHTHLS